MWEAPVPIFEDEDEDKLIDEFVRLSALYPEYPPAAITDEIFKNLRDPYPRANQAAMAWSTDLGIKERIRQAVVNGTYKQKEADLTLDDVKAKVLATIENDGLTYNEKKVRIDGYRTYAEIAKLIDSDDEKGRGHFPTIIFKAHPGSTAEPSNDAT